MASKKQIDSCAIHLEGGFLTTSDVTKLMEEAGALDHLGDDHRAFKSMLRDQVEDKVDFEMKLIGDKFIAKSDFEKTAEGVTNLFEFQKKRLNKLVGRNSLDTRRRGLKATLTNQMGVYQRMYESKLAMKDIKEGTPEERALFKAVHDFEEKINIFELTDKQAKEMAQGKTDIERLGLAVASYNEFARSTLLHSGVGVRFHSNFVISRRYDYAILENMGKPEFVSFMKSKLNAGESFANSSDLEVKKALGKVFDSIKKETNVHAAGLSTGTQVSAANSMTRKFVFDDADAAYDAFDQLSVGGLASQMDQNAFSTATAAIKVKELGYDHVNVQKMVDAAAAEKFGTEGMSNTQRVIDTYRQNRIKAATADFTGEKSYVPTALSTLSASMKTGVAVLKLGNAINTAILDVVDSGRQSFFVDGKMFGGYTEYLKNFAKVTFGMNKLERQELSEHLNVIFSYMSNGEAMRVARGDLATSSSTLGKYVEDFGGKAMAFSTFLPQQTGLSKLSSALTGVTKFDQMLKGVSVKDGKVDISKLNAFQKDTLKQYEISARDLSILKEVEKVKTWGDTELLTSKGIRDHLMQGDQEATAARLGVKHEELFEAANDLATKYDSFINDFYTRGTPTPELATKVALFKAGGEIQNVAMGLFTQFMDTPVAQLQNSSELMEKIIRVQRGQGKKGAELWAGVSATTLLHSMPYVTAGMGMYVGFNAMWAGLMGKESVIDKWQNGDAQQQQAVMLDVLGRTSWVPFAAELINNQTSSYYNTNALDTFASAPTLSIASDFLNMAKDSDDNNTFGKFAKRHMVPNAWYTQMVKNRL